MSAKVNCKKGYNVGNVGGGYVEFKKNRELESCPVSDAQNCEECKAKRFTTEEK